MILSVCGREMELRRLKTLLTSAAVWSGSFYYCTSSHGLVLWFKCNFILWENILTKGNSCLGVMTFVLMASETDTEVGLSWAHFLIKQTFWKEDCNVIH